MDENISSFIDSVIKQKKLQFLVKEINCSDSLFSEKIIQLDGDKISIINFEIISSYFLIKYKEKFDFKVVAEFEKNSNFINRIKDDFLDNGYVHDFHLLEKEIWKTVIIESNFKFKCSFNKYLNSIDLENKPRGINKFLNAYSNELPNLKLKTQDIFENVLILMDITKSDTDYNIDLGVVLKGIKEKCKEDYDLGLELLTKSLSLVEDKEQLLSTIVSGLYENKRINFYNSVLEELIEKGNKLNPIFFGLSNISVVEDEECQLFIKLIKNYDTRNSLLVSILSLTILILKTNNIKYHSYCFGVLIKAIKNENSASYIINNLNLINSSDSKKTDIIISFINQKYFSISKYIILVSNVFWHLKEFDSFKRIVLTLIETEPFTKFIKHFRSYLSSVDKMKLDIFIIALLTNNQARKRFVGLEIFDKLSTQIPYQFSLEILSLPAIDQYKLWVSLTQEFHDPKKRIVALIPLLNSKSELVKESFLCKLEELSEDYGGYIISIIEENFDKDNPNYSLMTERLKSFIDEFYNVNINLKMPIVEFNPYQTYYKHIRRFDELYHKTFNDSMNRGVEENSFLKYLGSNTIILSKGGGWKLGSKKEISKLGKYRTSLSLPRSYFIDPNLYELEKGQGIREDWTDKEFLTSKLCLKMNSNSIIVREYLGSLKEDSELDYLFPILLNLMGFRIIQTAKESKGQSQYGKDIIAIGKDENGIKHKWYFELKGYSDRDITITNFSKSDGIRESIIEAKHSSFNDSSIPEFNSLPIKIVIVHNGVLKTNFRNTFEGFITQEFKEGEFERWDIYYLTDLFSKYLFNEYLLSDDTSNRLLKKTLAFLDSPDNDYFEFKELVTLQFTKIENIRSRAFKKLFATLNLLNSIIFHYSKENNYLVPAIECSKFLVLKTWNWVLENNLQNKKPVVTEYRKLLKGQFEIFNNYFEKTLPIAKIENGLFSEKGAFFEKIGYPLRCFQYLDDLIYYYRLENSIVGSKENMSLKNKQKDQLIEVIENNNAFNRPILDNHSIPIIQLFLFFSDRACLRQKDVDFLYNYFQITVFNLSIEKNKYNRLPELYNRINPLVEFVALGVRPKEYCDSSSILLAVFLEISLIFDSEILFKQILTIIDDNLSLQIVSIDFENHNVENLLFEKHLHDEYYVDCIERGQEGLKLLKNQADFYLFKKSVLEKKSLPNSYKTDKLGLSCIRYLAHSYYKNEILPEEWRELINDKPNGL